MKKYIFTAIMLFGGMILLFGCGTDSEEKSPFATSTQPTKAVLIISTTGTLPAGALIGGIDVSVTLAPGVSLKTTGNATETDAGAVAASGVAASNSTVLATYSAPSGTMQGIARVLFANTSGFGTGEFVALTCDIAAGSNPRAADFSLVNFKARNLDGAEIAGLTPGFTADIR